MSQMIVVRHAQASLFADDYDQLSALGRQQAERLADQWMEAQLRLDAMISGPCRRHQDTAQIIRNRYAERGYVVPHMEVRASLDEHQVDRATFSLIDGDYEIREIDSLVNAARDTEPNPAVRQRNFQILFEAVAARWQAGNIRMEQVEPWDQFRQRVRCEVDRIRTEFAPRKIIAIFTSVGPIGVILQTAMRCGDPIAIETSWRVRNSSVSKFLFSGSRFTLDEFNSTAHLPTEMITYR